MGIEHRLFDQLNILGPGWKLGYPTSSSRKTNPQGCIVQIKGQLLYPSIQPTNTSSPGFEPCIYG